MNRSTSLALIAIGLIGFGIHRALLLPGMFVSPQVLLLLIVFCLQAIFGIAAGVGVWSRAPWAALAVVLLGASVVATALIEVVLGVIAALRALLDVGIAVVLTVLIVAFLRRPAEGSSTSRQ